MGRTRLDLAALAQAAGDREAALFHLQAAHALFQGLGATKYVERTAQSARVLGASLRAV